MALDTRNRRASAIHPTLPWRGLMPLPDGTVGNGDRAQTDLMYAGLAASDDPGGGVPGTGGTTAVSGMSSVSGGGDIGLLGGY